MKSFGRDVRLADLLPAVLSTMPTSFASVETWSKFVNEVVDKVKMEDVDYLPEVLRDLAAAGEAPIWSAVYLPNTFIF